MMIVENIGVSMEVRYEELLEGSLRDSKGQLYKDGDNVRSCPDTWLTMCMTCE